MTTAKSRRKGRPRRSKAEWLAYYRGLAVERGGACLSKEYASAHVKLRWRCEEGHEWEATPNSVRRGRWCDLCARQRRPQSKKDAALRKLQAAVRWRGGRVLDEYVSSAVKMRFRCSEGHEWKAVPASVIQGTWCPYCSGRLGRTLEDLQQVARERGGELLSTEFTGSSRPHRFRCAEGHEWEATPTNVIMTGTWCPRCAGTQRLTLADMHPLAEAHGGKCLSRRYRDCATPLRWRCRVGHEFRASPNAVQQGQWCPTCRGTQHGSLSRMRDIARRRGGRCLSKSYEGSMTPLWWRCGKGHEWEATPNAVLGGTWCPECGNARSGGYRRRLTITDMQEIAAARGGDCLSEVYVNCTTKLRWRCASGHEWEAQPNAVKHKSWCPVCARSVRGTLEGFKALAAERGGVCLSRHYENIRNELSFRCADGHNFRATGWAVKSGVWCPACSG